jgi:hypothetical protein
MWRTRDGYTVGLPRFRARRWRRRLGQRGRGKAELRRLARALGGVVAGALRLRAGAPASHPVFLSRQPGARLLIYTRAVSPRRVELLYIARRRPG